MAQFQFIKQLKDWIGMIKTFDFPVIGNLFAGMKPGSLKIWLIMFIALGMFFWFAFKYWEMTPWTRRDV